MTRPLVFDLRYATTHYPGVGSYAVGLAEALLAARPGWPWRVLMPAADGRFDLGFVPSVARVACKESPAPFRGQNRLAKLLRGMNAALYHSPYLLRPWGAKCASIVTVHDVIPLEHRAAMGEPRRMLYRWLVGDALGAACVVTDSVTSHDSIRAAFPNATRPAPSRDRERRAMRRPGSIVRPPADPLAIHPGCRVLESAEAWPAWPRPALLTVGINKPHKNLETLVRALALIPSEARPLLVSAGPTDERYPDVATLAAWHGVSDDVVSLGMIPESRLDALYRSAALFAFPTRIEGFGLPLLEALARGVPAIASDLLVLREIAGDAACWAPASDPVAWASAIRALLSDAQRREALAARGLERARRFSYVEAARQILPEYEALVPELAGESHASGTAESRTSGAGAPVKGRS
jgi:alpha-1,3-rhamnosyl/mannosyltransferase